jgi:hypothetical protein
MHSGFGIEIAYGIAFVIAENPNEAYEKVRKSLDNRDIGFDKDRELSSIELIAEQTLYPDCGYILYD